LLERALNVLLTHVLIQLQHFHFFWQWKAWRVPGLVETCRLISTTN